ncbi:MAG: hypothetical protein QNJ84_06895 [Alphaproteobacteria bacterium]|nr:hypothetical protein [Alphaproteobacteria bacterium]
MLQITTATVAMTALLFALFLILGVVFEEALAHMPNSVSGAFGVGGSKD